MGDGRGSTNPRRYGPLGLKHGRRKLGRTPGEPHESAKFMDQRRSTAPDLGVSGGPGGTEVARVKLRELGRRSLGAEGNKLLQKKTGPVAAEFIGIGKIIESAEGPHNRRPRSMLVASITSFVQAGQQRHTMQK